MELKLAAAEVETLIRGGLVSAVGIVVEAVAPGMARVRMPYRDSMIRPGNVLSGPSMFAAADLAMYALVLSHLGPLLMAVTSNLNINFLNKAKPGDLIAEARLLKLGRRLVVMEVSLYSSADPALCVAHVTGSYALPAS
ncbi:MAG TPA: PaaI family thioesterase [Fontimonas sp.]